MGQELTVCTGDQKEHSVTGLELTRMCQAVLDSLLGLLYQFHVLSDNLANVVNVAL